MASLYAPGIDNPRRMHENAIKRMERLTQSDRFKQMDTQELETNLAMFDKSFADFTSEHEKLIVKLRDPSKFALEDEFYATIQDLYRSGVIRFRKQMDTVEREMLLRSMARRAKEGATKERKPEPSEQPLNKQQQRDYEREQRRQRSVQLQDAAIHTERTREWINHLSTDTEEAELERKRQHINKQLAVLDQKQKELDLKAQQMEPKRQERSRSPGVNFEVRIPTTMESSHPVLLEIGANSRRLTERFGIMHGNREIDKNTGNINSVIVAPRSFDLRNKIATIQNRCCHFCGDNHKMYRCERFLRLNRSEREQHVGVLKLCKNCFMPLEDGRHRCRFGRCDNCGVGQFHNSLLCPVRHPN